MGKKVAACSAAQHQSRFPCVPRVRGAAAPRVPRRASTTGPNRSRSSCAAPGKAMDAIFFSSSLTVCSRRCSPCCKRRPVRTTAYSAGKADGVQRLAHHRCYGIVQQLVPQLFPAVLTLAANPVHRSTPGIGTAPTASAASGGGAAVQAAQQAAAPLFYLQSTGFFSFLRCCRAFFRPGTQQLDGVRSPVQKANRACTQYALFLLYTLHGLKQALT